MTATTKTPRFWLTAPGTIRTLLLGLAVSCFSPLAVVAAQNTTSQPTAEQTAATARENVNAPRRANFKQEQPSAESRALADWIVDSGDNRNLPFAVIDKVQAKVFVFHRDGQLRGATPVLLGSAVGDDSVPGIGDRALSTIRPEERTTPAGRFVAALAHDLHGQEILWVDYDTAISLHRVVTSLPKERRAQRLATPSPLDNRISFGCINVPVRFYETVVSPAFTGTDGIVYVLPETRSARDVFGSYDVDEKARLQGLAGS
jgi:hypothetical protein